MADYTDAEFSGLLDQLAQLPVEDRASDLLKLLKTLLTKNVTVQDWNTLIRDIAPLYATMLGLNDCMVNLINKVQRELGIFTGSSDSALSRIIALEDGTRSLANDKFDKTGGTIDGPVIITKGLTVRGTNTAVTTEHLRVEDAVIEANVGAKSVNDIPNLSGYVIHIGNGAAYGIVYDKIAKSVKLGLVEKGGDGNYQFESGEGQSVALRADTGDLIAGRLAVWNGNKNRFETKFQVAQDATRMTIVQRNTDGEVITAANPTSDNAAVPKKYVDNGFVAKQIPLATKSAYTTDTNGNQSLMIIHGGSAEPYSIASRSAGGVLKVGTPVADEDATPKKYADGRYVAKTTQTNVIYGTGNSGNPEYTHFSYNPTSWNVTKFDGTGCLRTNDPTGDDERQCINKQYADATYVAKRTADYKGLYGRLSDGTDWFAPFSENPELVAGNWTIAQRYTDGRLKVGTPVDDADATPKKYVDDGFVAKGTVNKACYNRSSTGAEGMISYSENNTAWTLAQRAANGVLRVGTPVGNSDAINLEYFTTRLNAVTGVSPYFMHNVCITRTVDNLVDTVRISLVCTQVTEITSVAALHALIVQLNGGYDSAAGSAPVWHGACNMSPYNSSENTPDSMLVYSGYIGLWNNSTLRAWGDTVYPGAAYGVTLDDTNWTVSDKVLNAVVGGTTA